MPVLDPKVMWRDPERGNAKVEVFGNFVLEPFTTALKAIEELNKSGSVISDPALGSALTPQRGSPGLVAQAVVDDFMGSNKAAMYKLTQKIGFNDPQIKLVTGQMFDIGFETADLIASLTKGPDVFNENLVNDMIKSAALNFLGQLSAVPNIYVQIAAQIGNAIIAISEAVSASQEKEISDEKLIPLQTSDTSSDEIQVRAIQSIIEAPDPEGAEVVIYRSSKDRDSRTKQARAQYTPFFLPRFKGGWKWEWRTLDIGGSRRSAGVAFQRSTFKGRENNADGNPVSFSPNVFDGINFCAGFMPGAQFCQSVIQTQFGRVVYKDIGVKGLTGNRIVGYYSNPSRKKRGDWIVNKYNIRGRYKDRACEYGTGVKATMSAYNKNSGRKGIDYDYNCRHGVSIESVWPGKKTGGGTEFVPIFTHPLMQTTPSSNVGQFYNTTNKLLFNLWGQINEPGPLMYSVDCQEMLDQWQAYFETFWLQAPTWWRKYEGWGWRGQVAMAISHMMCSRPVGWENDDPSQENDWIIGPSMAGVPSQVIPDIEDKKPHMPWSQSIFECVIKPAVMDLARRQYQFLDTSLIAYLPAHAGAYFRWSGNKYYADGKPYQNNIVARFYENRRALLTSGKRMNIDLRMVIDPEYRQALIDSGVKWPNRFAPWGGGMKLATSPSSTGIEPLKPGMVFTKALIPTGGTPMTTMKTMAIAGTLDPEVKEEAEGVRKKKGGGGAAMMAVAGLGALMLAKGGKGKR